jgi:hypothetical protein
MSWKWRTPQFGAILVALVAITLAGVPSVSADARIGTTSLTPQFTVVPSPPTGYNEPASLNAISTSGQAAWAVGDAGSPTSYPIIEHEVGGTWTLSTAAPAGTNGGVLTGVAAVSDSDVWAVGGDYDADSNQHPLVQHFEGTAWSNISFAGAGEGTGIVYDVKFTAPSDGWAVGYSGSSAIAAAAYHFDGSRWQPVQLPRLPSQPILYAAAARSAADVFAVGAAFAGPTQAIALHYDGASWAALPGLPAIPGATNTILTGADVVGTGQLWAVGLWQDAPGNLHPLAAFWSGSAWTVSAVPEVPGVEGNTLFRVRAAGPDDVWAVGSWRATDATLNPFMLHFDGTQWTQVQLPDPGNSYAQLSDIGFLADGTILSVGETNGPAALIEQASPAVGSADHRAKRHRHERPGHVRGIPSLPGPEGDRSAFADGHREPARRQRVSRRDDVGFGDRDQ